MLPPSSKDSIFRFVAHDETNETAWYYVKVKKSYTPIFLKHYHSGNVNLDHPSIEILESGYGPEIPEYLERKYPSASLL